MAIFFWGGGSPENSGGFGLAMDYREEQIHEVVLKLPQAAGKSSKYLIEVYIIGFDG